MTSIIKTRATAELLAETIRSPLARRVQPGDTISYRELEGDDVPRRLRVLVKHEPRGGVADGSAWLYDGEELREGLYHEHHDDEWSTGAVELPRGDGTSDVLGLPVE